MSGWLLILSLLVLGAALSTLGDRLGSRVGKARLRLFNMRPRRTAVVITILTGSLISAISFGLMLLVSRRLRVGLFELDTLQARLKESRERLDAAKRERVEARSATARAEDRLGVARRRADTLRQELTLLQKQRQDLETDKDRLSRDIADRDVDIQRKEAELGRVRNQIKLGKKELNDLERNLVALRRGAVVPWCSAVVKSWPLPRSGQSQLIRAKRWWIICFERPISMLTVKFYLENFLISKLFASLRAI
ncbi:hypothetical protein CREGCYN_04260 [Synechococcus sp. M16CYN]